MCGESGAPSAASVEVCRCDFSSQKGADATSVASVEGRRCGIGVSGVAGSAQLLDMHVSSSVEVVAPDRAHGSHRHIMVLKRL